MTSYITKTKIGRATYDGQTCYEFGKCHLTRSGLSVSRFEDEHRFAEFGPHFSFAVVNSKLLQGMIFSHLCYSFTLPCTYRFSGPVLGYLREYSGYSAAASGGNQRPIEQLTMVGNLSEQGLSLDISGVAGHIIEGDCASKDQQFIKKNFSVSLLIDPSFIPPVIDIRTAGNIFERRFLGKNETTNVFPSVVEP